MTLEGIKTVADTRRHRGAHPEDESLFASERVPGLQAAVSQLSWLLTHGYSMDSSLKLVGDRHSLRQRQRTAVRRASCAETSLRNRRQRHVLAEQLAGEVVFIDGFNLLTTIEAALAGGVILACKDGCYRDMASMQGTYRRVMETDPALACLRDWLDRHGVTTCHWYLDQPVSNSGRLKRVLEQVGDTTRADWTVELVPDPDRTLVGVDGIVISADSQVIDACRRWHNLAAGLVESEIPDAWVVRLDDVTRD